MIGTFFIAAGRTRTTHDPPRAIQTGSFCGIEGSAPGVCHAGCRCCVGGACCERSDSCPAEQDKVCARGATPVWNNNECRWDCACEGNVAYVCETCPP